MNWIWDEESETAIPFEVKTVENHMVWGLKCFDDDDKEFDAVDIHDIYDDEMQVYDMHTF